MTAQAVEHILTDAEVHALQHRQEDGAALGVLATMLAQVLVLGDVRIPRRRLFGRSEGPSLPSVNCAKFISDWSRGM